MKFLIYSIIALLSLFFNNAHAEFTNDEQLFIIGRAMSFAYTLDAVSDICNGSLDSREKFNTLKNIVKDTLGQDLYKFEGSMNKESGMNFRDELKIETTNHIKKIGGCGSQSYYEWLVKPQKAYAEALMIITNMKQ